MSCKSFLCSATLPFQSCLGGQFVEAVGACLLWDTWSKGKERELTKLVNKLWFRSCRALTILSLPNQKSLNFQICAWKWTKAYSHRKKKKKIQWSKDEHCLLHRLVDIFHVLVCSSQVVPEVIYSFRREFSSPAAVPPVTGLLRSVLSPGWVWCW